MRQTSHINGRFRQHFTSGFSANLVLLPKTKKAQEKLSVTILNQKAALEILVEFDINWNDFYRGKPN